jgi:4-hydroxy-tetrahydrodipicolinate synthase
MKIQGVHVALVTPFEESGAVSYPAFINHLNFLADSGVHGFVPCGTTGEGPTLSHEEWRRLTELSVEVAKKRGLSVTAGCGSNDTKKVVALTREAKELGCDAALIVTPYYNRPTAAGIESHFLHIADNTDLPIVLYNVPGRTNINMTPELMAKLMKHPRIVGVKECSGSWNQWITLSTSIDLNTRAFLTGDDDCLAAVLALGGSGMISGPANVAPHFFVSIYECAQKGDWATAFQIQKRILPFVKVMFMETNPGPVKYALSRLSEIKEEVRLPLVKVTEPTRKAVYEALQLLELRPR